MRPADPAGPVPRARLTAAVLSLGLAAAAATAGGAFAQSGSGIVGTKHDLSRFGPGPGRATGETRICIFCHTPHNAVALSPALFAGAALGCAVIGCPELAVFSVAVFGCCAGLGCSCTCISG